MQRVLVVGIGNDLRGDDGAGLVAVRRALPRLPRDVMVREEQGDPSALVAVFAGADAAVLVDAVRSGAPPGTIRRVDARTEEVAYRGSTSTHAVGLGEAIELARALGRLPRQVIMLAIEGADFRAGAGLSGQVERAMTELVDAVVRETLGLRRVGRGDLP